MYISLIYSSRVSLPVDHCPCQRHRLCAVAVPMSVIHKETLHSKVKCHPLASHPELDGITDALSNKSALKCDIILHARVDSFQFFLFCQLYHAQWKHFPSSKQLEMTVLTFNSRRLHSLTLAFWGNKTKRRQAWQKR